MQNFYKCRRIEPSLFDSPALTLHWQCSFRLLISSGEGLQIVRPATTGVNWYCFPNFPCYTEIHHRKICAMIL